MSLHGFPLPSGHCPSSLALHTRSFIMWPRAAASSVPCHPPLANQLAVPCTCHTLMSSYLCKGPLLALECPSPCPCWAPSCLSQEFRITLHEVFCRPSRLSRMISRLYCRITVLLITASEPVSTDTPPQLQVRQEQGLFRDCPGPSSGPKTQGVHILSLPKGKTCVYNKSIQEKGTNEEKKDNSHH